MANKSPYQRIVKRMASSGIVVSGPANLFDLLLSHDGSNNPTFTIYDNTEAAGDPVYSATWTEDERPIGWINSNWRFVNGIYVTINTIGSGWLTFGYNQINVLTGGA